MFECVHVVGPVRCDRCDNVHSPEMIQCAAQSRTFAGCRVVVFFLFLCWCLRIKLVDCANSLSLTSGTKNANFMQPPAWPHRLKFSNLSKDFRPLAGRCRTMPNMHTQDGQTFAHLHDLYLPRNFASCDRSFYTVFFVCVCSLLNLSSHTC